MGSLHTPRIGKPVCMDACLIALRNSEESRAVEKLCMQSVIKQETSNTWPKN